MPSAQQSGVSFQEIQKYEKGTNRVSASRLQELASALDVKPSYLFEGLPDENKSGEQVDGKTWISRPRW
ncbi:helix-turn-helix transcriptional regulator (plasmid) [Sinorhizobium meliloti]|uniref:helix-turn-helix domain-containing protein n=1 Tax=Rhizobium meliloti TaxID=382 RepID=UPI00299EC01F